MKPRPMYQSTASRLAWPLTAPRRLGFFAAALMLVFSSIWWSSVLAARALGATSGLAVTPSVAHSLLMSLGLTPLLIVVFLFTAARQWLGLPAVNTRHLLFPVAIMLGGWAITLLGLRSQMPLASAGVALVATGWVSLCLKFITLLRLSRSSNRAHATVVTVACVGGALTLWLAAASLTAGSELLLRSAVRITLWGFAATLFAAATYHIRPLFSASDSAPPFDARRPMWWLWGMMAVLWLKGLEAVAELWFGAWPPAARWCQVALELPAALLLLSLILRRSWIQHLKNRRLAMLYGGVAWLGIALALYALSHTLMALTGNALSLGLAPLHAMTMGYLGSTLFAMSSGRVDRPVTENNVAWTLYWVLQLAIVLRVMTAL